MTDRNLITEVKTVAGKVRDDAETLALSLDGLPINGDVVGAAFGAVLAMVEALAVSIRTLATEMARMSAALTEAFPQDDGPEE